MRILIICLFACSLITACSKPENVVFESDAAASDEAKAEREAKKIAKKIDESREAHQKLKELSNTLKKQDKVSLSFKYKLTTRPNQLKIKTVNNIPTINDPEPFLPFIINESSLSHDRLGDKSTQDLFQQAIKIIDLKPLNPNPFKYFEIFVENSPQNGEEQKVKLRIEFDGTNLEFDYDYQSRDSYLNPDGYHSDSLNRIVYYQLIIEQDN
jgi:hypothetical protein